MNYKYLGKTGIQVSELCFGTMSFGGDANQKESEKMFSACLNLGINFFDCANTYNGGNSEKILGKLIKADRDSLIITSKVFNATSNDINHQGLSRRNITRAVESSLKRLNTDRIEVLFLHRWDPNTPIDETLRGLEDLVRAGKVLHLGASNFAAWQISKAIGVSVARGWSRLEVVQPMYSLVKRQAEVEILPLAKEENLGVISYSPLGGGLLSGKYSAGKQPKGSRLVVNSVYAQRYRENWFFETASNLSRFAKKLGVHPVTLSLAWVMANEMITAPIIGSRNLSQLQSSLAALEFEMTSEVYLAISQLSRNPPPATDRSEIQPL